MGQYTEYTVSVAATSEARFHCKSCGHTDEARATMSSQLTRKKAGWHHAESEAENHRAAIANEVRPSALKGAASIIRLAPCPKCNVRDAASVRRHVLLAVAETLFVACAAVGLAYLAYHLISPSDASKGAIGAAAMSGILAIGALVQTFLVPSQARMLYREAPELVTFGAPPAPPVAKRSAEPDAERADRRTGAKARARREARARRAPVDEG